AKSHVNALYLRKLIYYGCTLEARQTRRIVMDLTPPRPTGLQWAVRALRRVQPLRPPRTPLTPRRDSWARALLGCRSSPPRRGPVLRAADFRGALPAGLRRPWGADLKPSEAASPAGPPVRGFGDFAARGFRPPGLPRPALPPPALLPPACGWPLA